MKTKFVEGDLACFSFPKSSGPICIVTKVLHERGIWRSFSQRYYVFFNNHEVIVEEKDLMKLE